MINDFIISLSLVFIGILDTGKYMNLQIITHNVQQAKIAVSLPGPVETMFLHENTRIYK